MHTYTPGCVNCVRVCNQDLKKKLEKLFPAIPHKKLEEVLPDSMGEPATLQELPRPLAATPPFQHTQ